MSMYNLLFGQSNYADLLLAALGMTRSGFYRYRDAYLDAKGRIAVYTRGGGGNRECFCDAYAKDEDRTVDLDGDKHAPGCVVLKHRANRQHPAYLYNEDDDFDCTYATFYFAVPAEVDREALAAVEPEMKREDVWAAFLDALKAK